MQAAPTMGQGQNAGMMMGGEQGKGGMPNMPMNPQMMGMGAMGKGMPNMNMPSAMGKGGMPNMPMNPQMMGMGAMGKGMPNMNMPSAMGKGGMPMPMPMGSTARMMYPMQMMHPRITWMPIMRQGGFRGLAL